MYQLITKSRFHDAFHHMGRGDQFSYEALDALYDWLESYESDQDEKGIELDVIALCCEYREDDINDVLRKYNLTSLEELEENTCVIWHDDEKVLYQQY